MDIDELRNYRYNNDISCRVSHPGKISFVPKITAFREQSPEFRRFVPKNMHFPEQMAPVNGPVTRHERHNVTPAIQKVRLRILPQCRKTGKYITNLACGSCGIRWEIVRKPF